MVFTELSPLHLKLYPFPLNTFNNFSFPFFQNVLCKELTLPPSDLAHSAARVCVIPSSGDSQSAACVAVSPEGVVRYWPNIAYEASSSEISAELKGEECDCVVNLAVSYKYHIYIKDSEVWAGSIDPDQTATQEHFDLGLYCLLRPHYLNSLDNTNLTFSHDLH